MTLGKVTAEKYILVVPHTVLYEHKTLARENGEVSSNFALLHNTILFLNWTFQVLNLEPSLCEAEAPPLDSTFCINLQKILKVCFNVSDAYC